MTNKWSRSAKTHLPPDGSTRVLNALVRGAAIQTLARSIESKPKSLFPALRDELSQEVLSFALDCSWTEDGEIAELNSQYRGKNHATDVLSFPFWEGETMWSGDELPLGDLVLSLQTAVRQAQELKHSLEDEIAFLTIHGVLHLLGFDHDSSSKRRTMFGWQDEVFAALGTADVHDN